MLPGLCFRLGGRLRHIHIPHDGSERALGAKRVAKVLVHGVMSFELFETMARRGQEREAVFGHPTHTRFNGSTDPDGRMGFLDRLRCHRHIRVGIKFPRKREALLSPGPDEDIHDFFHAHTAFFAGDTKSGEFLGPVSWGNAEYQTSFRQQIDNRCFFGQVNRIIEGQQDHAETDLDAARSCRHTRGTGQ